MKNLFKKRFLQNVLVFIDLFHRYRYQIAYDIICVQYVIKSNFNIKKPWSKPLRVF